MKKLTNNKIFMLVAYCIAIIYVVGSSIFQGQYSVDSHHWGLMLSNVTDLFQSKIPYKEIFIQYGFLTTLIHAFAFFIFNNLLGLILITSVCYVIGIILISKLAFLLSQNRLISFIILLLCTLIHPLAIYPWSNYVAFPFLIYGFYGLLFNDKNKLVYLLSGISFGCAVLAREGLFIAIFLLIYGSFFLDAICKNQNFDFSKFISITYGFIFPIFCFILYLKTNNIFEYWYVNSFLLPRLFINSTFTHLSSLLLFKPMYVEFLYGIKNLDPRWIFIFLVLLTCVIHIVIFLFNRDKSKIQFAKISLSSLLLMSTAIHLTEIFRISTASIIGILTLINIYKSNIYFRILIFSFIAWLGSTIYTYNSGNYFLPTSEKIHNSKIVLNFPPFNFQKWNLDTLNYYSSFKNDLLKISKMNCNIKYHYNDTYDVFLKVISPFSQFQFIPMNDGPFGKPKDQNKFDDLRPDFDYKNKFTIDKNIILFINNIENVPFFNKIETLDYKKFSSYDIPLGMYTNKQLNVYIPSKCTE